MKNSQIFYHQSFAEVHSLTLLVSKAIVILVKAGTPWDWDIIAIGLEFGICQYYLSKTKIYRMSTTRIQSIQMFMNHTSNFNIYANVIYKQKLNAFIIYKEIFIKISWTITILLWIYSRIFDL